MKRAIAAALLATALLVTPVMAQEALPSPTIAPTASELLLKDACWQAFSYATWQEYEACVTARGTLSLVPIELGEVIWDYETDDYFGPDKGNIFVRVQLDGPGARDMESYYTLTSVGEVSYMSDTDNGEYLIEVPRRTQTLDFAYAPDNAVTIWTIERPTTEEAE